MMRLHPSERLPMRGWWRRVGAYGRVCALLALAAVVGTAGLLFRSGNGGGLDRGAWDPALVIVVGVVWAMGVAVASGLSSGGYLVAGLWLGWHGVGLMGAWTGTPMAALPVGWWLLVGLAGLAWQGPRRKTTRGILWLAMAMGAGYLLAGPVGWGRLPGALGESILGGRLVLGGGFAVAGWWLLPRLRGWTWTEPGFGKVLGGGLVVMAVGLGGSILRDAGATAGWAMGAVETTGFLAALGWFWLGGLFAAELVYGIEAAQRKCLKPSRAEGPRRWAWPAVWSGVTALEWMATHQAAWGNWPAGLAAWTTGWPAPFQLVAAAHGWVGIVVIVLGAGFLLQGRGGRVYLLRLNALWGAAFLALLAVAEAFPGEPGGGEFPVWRRWGPIVILSAGWMAWGGRMIGEDRRQPAVAGQGRSGGMVMVLGVVLAVEIASPGRWVEWGGTAALLGMVHLALPHVLCQWWRGGDRPEAGLPLTTSLWLSAAGLMVVLPLLHWNVATVSQMALCPLLWLPLLLLLKWQRPALDMASGALAGAILASATVAGWCRPGLLLPEVPLFSWLNPPLAGLPPAGMMERPFWNPVHFTLLLMMTGAGGILGAIVFRGKSDPVLPLMPLLADPVEGGRVPPASL